MYRCDRNRKRSKRRPIFCPTHSCYLDSISQKHALFADQVEQLRDRGISRKTSHMLLENRTTISLTGEWLEEFWCPECQCRAWYHVQRQDSLYKVARPPQELWQQAAGVIDPVGNSSVGEFTRNSAKRSDYQCGGSKSMRWAG
jgi:hypothetical protein